MGGEMFDLVGAALALRSAQIIALQAALLHQPLAVRLKPLLLAPESNIRRLAFKIGAKRIDIDTAATLVSGIDS